MIKSEHSCKRVSAVDLEPQRLGISSRIQIQILLRDGRIPSVKYHDTIIFFSSKSKVVSLNWRIFFLKLV